MEALAEWGQMRSLGVVIGYSEWQGMGARQAAQYSTLGAEMTRVQAYMDAVARENAKARAKAGRR